MQLYMNPRRTSQRRYSLCKRTKHRPCEGHNVSVKSFTGGYSRRGQTKKSRKKEYRSLAILKPKAQKEKKKETKSRGLIIKQTSMCSVGLLG